MDATSTFVDQTLEEALRNKRLSIADYRDVEQKISTMSQVVFDASLQSLEAVLRYRAMDENLRARIQLEADQVARSHSLGCDNIKANLSHNDVGTMPAALQAALRQAQAWGMTVALQITGGCRYSESTVASLCRIVREYGINSLVFDDLAGELDPLATYRELLALQQRVPCPVEYYGNNAQGLATGNALAAMRSGVRRVAVAVGGIGGYPAFEEVLMGARYLLQLPLAIPGNMAVCCQAILAHIGQRVQITKPIIGSHIFAHESGIHVDGVQKKSDLYEPFTPEVVGLKRKIIIGKHSGKAAIELKLAEMNISVRPEGIRQVLEKVRGLAIRQKAPVSNIQLQKLVYEVTS